MKQDDAAAGFAAMGSAPRLAVLRILVRAGEEGLPIGEIGARTGIAPSTLAHHLRALADAGIVRQERAGRSTLTRADFARLQALADFVLTECCADAGAGSHDHHRCEGAEDG